MASPRMLGMFKPCVSNAQADRRGRPKAWAKQQRAKQLEAGRANSEFSALLRTKLEAKK